jgi:hypothetical protein
VAILEEGLHWIRPIYWTEEDQQKRDEAIAIRRKYLEKLLIKSQKAIAKRLLKEKKKLWFDLQPLNVQQRILKSRAYRQVSRANRRYRAYHIKQAAFHWWYVR